MTNTHPPAVVPKFIAEPLTENCRTVCSRGEHVLIGVSPGNSYFSPQRLTELLSWAASLFRRIDVMIPDSAQVHTWLALGYAANRARRKAYGEGSRLFNRATRAWEAVEAPGVALQLHRLSEIETRPAYQALLRESEEAIAGDTDTRESYGQAVRQVLRNHLHGAEPTAAQTEQAARYLIAETPFLINTPKIIGVESSTAVYQHRVAFIDRIYAGKTSLYKADQQAFVVARPAA
ncbi:tRNA-dependent cyclodipeptide synthase [Streptomyces zagrosensis]|uniref:Cyclodipeptide synthase n=1 Tax=Streptomyces zagrosensis TaxID=1042984 RepID=A0A7W9UY51_9ACTN|nr:tRNA-dependent cyclodipeptide synthase [Streptomyces zagrosensis]MBB5934439.1 cyclo(L-tyrosyl-L-tyrosyl) synthase [Streptomyces zagrosensis]